MIVCFEIDQDTKKQLDQLLKAGQYRDYSQAIAVAIANQLLLHDRFVGAAGGSLIVRDEIASRDAGYAGPVSCAAASAIPNVFALPPVGTNLEFAPIPGDAFIPGTAVPVDRWIFGQHNKLLPVKASCRWLANVPNGKGVPLARAAPEIAALAAELGDYLQDLDDQNGLLRDELLSSGFPVKRKDTEGKGRLRFANQFVGSMTKHGQLSGMLIDLKLVNYAPSKQPRLFLTEPGWRFAAIENPILDCGADRLPKFSDKEVEFLLEHIRLRVPAEHFAFHTVTKALVDGVNTPERLDEYLARYLSNRTEKPFTEAFLTTQRSGAISRMSDLGLVERQRDGIKVTYIPTERAVHYLERSETGGQA
jgi:hypothetical protein